MIYLHWLKLSFTPTLILATLLGATRITLEQSASFSYSKSTGISLALEQEAVEQLIQIGLEHYRQGQYGRARDRFQRAVDQSIALAHSEFQGLSLTYLSLTQQKLQDWSAAEQSSQTGLQIFKQSPTINPRYLALAFNTQGRLFFSLGKVEEALKEWEKAEAYYKKSDDSEGAIGSLINQAQALTVLGFHHRACKSLFSAIALEGDCNTTDSEALDKAITAFQTQPNQSVRSLGLLTLGNLLRLAGNYKAAQQLLSSLEQQSSLDQSTLMISLGKLHQAYYEKRLKIYQRTSSTQEQDNSLKLALQSAQRSLEYYQKAAVASPHHLSWQPLQIRLLQLGLLTHIQTILNPQPNQFPSLGNAIATIPQLKQQLLQSNLDQLPPSQSVIQGQLLLAKELQKTNHPDDRTQALRYAQTALTGAKKNQNVSAQAQALGIFGKLYEQAQQWQDAQTATQQALALANSTHDHQQIAEWQWQLGRLHQNQGDRTQALQAYQHSVKNLKTVRQNLSVMQNEVEFSFRENVEPVYRQYISLLLGSNLKGEAHQINFKQVLQVFDDFQIAELEDFLNCNLQLRAKQVPDSISAFIYPIVLEDRIEVIIQLPSQSFQRYSVPISASELDQTLSQLRRELEQTYHSPKGITLSQKVYNWILKPGEVFFEDHNVKNLVFILDVPLRNIPIGTLHDGKQYLVEKGYSIALLPGPELLEPKSNPQTPLKALTFGLAQDSPPLRHVPEELSKINQLLDVKEYLDESFSNQALESQLIASSFPIVHLATHGQFSSDPSQTYLKTWQDTISGDQLSRLLQNRANRPGTSPIELLVLSACKTATGDPRAVLGLAGIAVQSGARSTLSSLWSINDRSTAILMSEFYQQLSSSSTMTKAEALRRAQVTLMGMKGYESPRYWGAFVLVGHWE